MIRTMHDNRRTIANRIDDALVEVRQAMSGASTGPDDAFSCVLRLRNALALYLEAEPCDQCARLGEARMDAERCVEHYRMPLRDVVNAIGTIGRRLHGWEN
jgi:hypothetical protein